jgi:hypothetical protein
MGGDNEARCLYISCQLDSKNSVRKGALPFLLRFSIIQLLRVRKRCHGL